MILSTNSYSIGNHFEKAIKDTKPDLPMIKGSWQNPGWLINWPLELTENLPSPPKVPQFVRHPYFEKDVEDLVGKGYVTDGKLIND